MKVETQKNPELTRLCELVEDISVAMLTTADDAGAMVSRPMSPLLMDGAGAIWFFTDRNSSKTNQLLNLNLSFSDLSDSTYVSVSGHGEINTDRARIDELWTSFVLPWFPEGKDSPNLALLKITPQIAEYWDAPDSKMVRMFAMGASIVAGKPIGMGEHDTLTRLNTNAPSNAVRHPVA
jgi:general stress protein 26